MKIFVPLNENCDINELIKYGDEFYFSFSFIEWDENNDSNVNYQTRGRNNRAIFKDIDKLKNNIDVIKGHKKEAFLTLNSHSFDDSQIPQLRKIIKLFISMGGSGIIASDLLVIKLAQEFNTKIYLSTIFGLYNLEAIKFITNRYKVDRVILHRDISFLEIKRIKENIDIEVECFALYSGCRFSNANCYAVHTKEGGLCRFSIETKWDFKDCEEKNNHELYSNHLLNSGCGLCAIYDFVKIGIDSIKITGREMSYQEILSSTKLVKEIVEIANQSKNKKMFLDEIKKIDKINDRYCEKGLNCFYQELGLYHDYY